MESIAKQIAQVDERQLNDIISAVMHRYNALHDDRYLGFYTVSNDPQTREAELEYLIHTIRHADETDEICHSE